MLETFGRSEGCSVFGFDVQQKEELLCFQAKAGKLTIPVEMELEGEHYVADALAAVAVGLKLAVPARKIAEALRTFRNISGRQEIYKAGFTFYFTPLPGFFSPFPHGTNHYRSPSSI